MKLVAESLGYTACAVSDKSPQKALNKPLSKDDLIQRISKCGGTQFFVNKINICIFAF